MAIFAGDVPGCLLRMPARRRRPRTPDEAYAMTRKGQTEVCARRRPRVQRDRRAVRHGVLIVSAPTLADFALRFSSFEYFWLVLLGLSCAIVITSERPLKGVVSPAARPARRVRGPRQSGRASPLHAGSTELMGGIGLIPMMIGMFAVSEIIRYAVGHDPQWEIVDQPIGNVFKGMWHLTKKYPVQILRGNASARWWARCRAQGADIAAWMSYAISKKFSKEPRSSAPATSRASSSRAPRTTARSRARGSRARVRHSRRLDHGDRDRRAVHEEHEPGADAVHAEPAEHLRGVPAVHPREPDDGPARLGVHQGRQADPARAAQRADADHPAVLRGRHVRDQQHGVRRRRHAGAGVAAYVLEENGIPSAPAILGVVLGGMLEENFITSMIKSNGDLTAFFSRPIAATLGALTLGAWFLPPLVRRPAPPRRRLTGRAPGASCLFVDPAWCGAVKSSGFDAGVLSSRSVTSGRRPDSPAGRGRHTDSDAPRMLVVGKLEDERPGSPPMRVCSIGWCRRRGKRTAPLAVLRFRSR
jgi:hypothetical protein